MMSGELLDRGIGWYLTFEEVMDNQDIDGPLFTGNVNPGHVIGFALGAAYVTWPLDFIPDYIPVVGYIDDAFVLNFSTSFSGWLWDKFD